MLDRGKPGAGDGPHHLARRLVDSPRLIDWDVAVEVDHDPGGAVVVVDLGLPEAPTGGAARHPASGPVIDRIAADRGGRCGAQDETRVVVRTRNQDRVPGMLPHGALQRVVARWKRPGGTLSMHVHPAELRRELPLDQGVAEL